MKKKQQHTLPFIDKVFLCLTIGLCLALLLSYVASFTDPKKIWLIAFFGLAYPPLLLVNLLMVTYWALRKSKLILLPLLTILCGFGILQNNIGFRLSSKAIKPADTNAIRVMTYNVHDFKKYGAGKEIAVKTGILDAIAAEQPDIIGIQEFYTRKRGEYAMVDSLKRIMQSNNYYYENFGGSEEEIMGIAIFSRYPIVSKGMIQLSDINNGNQCLYIDVKKNKKTIRFYSVHLQSISFGSEDYRYLDTVIKKGKADLESTKRLGGKIKRAFIKRSEQVLLVKTHARQCPYPYIIAGDFNDTPSSFAVNQMAKGLKNTFREKGSGMGRTYNGDFPNYQIDYIMTTSQFDVTGYRIIEKKLSDHYPVCADLVLR
ncbi:endonuclease/exonuclease/phosphatase family protein [Mucilaginibacter antarcticus]|uniref:Endonuclease/exonuclease/phosphatase family protein n=1 Tax=Mucilaginibacter antarcticus TaxID=1855725 RepID=A0ABW5XQS5_9SPHI